MQKRTSLKEHLRAWTVHVQDLHQLKWNLETDDRNRLDHIISDLHAIVQRANHNLKLSREGKK